MDKETPVTTSLGRAGPFHVNAFSFSGPMKCNPSPTSTHSFPFSCPPAVSRCLLGSFSPPPFGMLLQEARSLVCLLRERAYLFSPPHHPMWLRNLFVSNSEHSLSSPLRLLSLACVTADNISLKNGYWSPVDSRRRVSFRSAAMQDAGCSGLEHWGDPEGWHGEGGGRGFRMGTTCTPLADSC